MTTSLCETRHDQEVIDGIITFDTLTGKFAICKDRAGIGFGKYLLYEGKIKLPLTIKDYQTKQVSYHLTAC